MNRRGYSTIRLALAFQSATGIGHLAARFFGGAGLIFTLHHVRPPRAQTFTPNAMLEVTPEFLDGVIPLVRSEGFETVSLDEAARRLRHGGPRFAAFTLDDGYRDNVEHALPVFRRNACPFTMFVVPDFLDGKGELWWLGLEESIRRLESVPFAGLPNGFVDARDDQGKTRAFSMIYSHLRSLDDKSIRETVRHLCHQAGFDLADLCRPLCMDWDELSSVASDPLVTIGSHTMSHPFLATIEEGAARMELARSKVVLRERLGRPIRHVAYPVGDRSAAGPREFAMAAELGYEIGVTTRPGMLFPDHAGHMTALPRVSLNGAFQDLDQVRQLITGLPFAVHNGFRRVNVD